MQRRTCTETCCGCYDEVVCPARVLPVPRAFSPISPFGSVGLPRPPSAVFFFSSQVIYCSVRTYARSVDCPPVVSFDDLRFLEAGWSSDSGVFRDVFLGQNAIVRQESSYYYHSWQFCRRCDPVCGSMFHQVSDDGPRPRVSVCTALTRSMLRPLAVYIRTLSTAARIDRRIGRARDIRIFRDAGTTRQGREETSYRGSEGPAAKVRQRRSGSVYRRRFPWIARLYAHNAHDATHNVVARTAEPAVWVPRQGAFCRRQRCQG
jgi:hypothetical protein